MDKVKLGTDAVYTEDNPPEEVTGKPKRTRTPEDPAIKAIKDNVAKEAKAMKEIIKAVDRIAEVATSDSLIAFAHDRIQQTVGIKKTE